MTAVLPDDPALEPGVQPVKVTRTIALGDPETPHTGFHSNLAVFMLVPHVTSAVFAAGVLTVQGTRLFAENKDCQTIIGDTVIPGANYLTHAPAQMSMTLPTMPAAHLWGAGAGRRRGMPGPGNDYGTMNRRDDLLETAVHDWTAANAEFLAGELHGLRLRLQRRVRWLRRQWQPNALHGYAEVVSDAQADWLLQGENRANEEKFFAADEETAVLTDPAPAPGAASESCPGYDQRRDATCPTPASADSASMLLSSRCSCSALPRTGAWSSRPLCLCARSGQPQIRHSSSGAGAIWQRRKGPRLLSPTAPFVASPDRVRKWHAASHRPGQPADAPVPRVADYLRGINRLVRPLVNT